MVIFMTQVYDFVTYVHLGHGLLIYVPTGYKQIIENKLGNYVFVSLYHTISTIQESDGHNTRLLATASTICWDYIVAWII